MIDDSIIGINFYTTALNIVNNQPIKVKTFYKINADDYSIMFQNNNGSVIVELLGNKLSVSDSIDMGVTNTMTLNGTQVTNFMNAVKTKAITIANSAITVCITHFP